MLKKLYLHHFRNYTQEEIVFSPGINWITGDNAQGKTNLLEAIYLLSTGRSFRTHKLTELIQTGASFFYIEAEIEKERVSQTLKISFDGEAKKVQYNSTSYSHFTPLIGLLPHVLYAPEDLALASGAPAHRRKFLDLHLSQIDPLYLHHLVRYHRAMRQRNELLRNKTEALIEPWEESMAISGSYLMQKRSELISDMQKPLSTMMKTLSSNRDDLELSYHSSLPSSDQKNLLHVLQKNRKKELYIGSTLHGPHRDDLQFLMEKHTAKSYASEGQKHCIVASLRLSQWKHLQKQRRETPLLSIDDFGAHLDPTRQKNFEHELKNLGQIFLTSPEVLPDVFPEKQIIEITSGKIS